MTELRIVLATGSFAMLSEVYVVDACDVWETASLWAETTVVAATPASDILASSGTCCEAPTFAVFVVSPKPESENVNV